METIWNLLEHPRVEQFGSYFYKYFYRYFLDQEVGHSWSVFNGMLSTFVIGFLALYVMKSWGLTSWNRNLVKNKKRFMAIAIRRLKEDLFKDGHTDATVKRRQDIVALNFDELHRCLQSGELSAEAAVDSYRWKALECHEQLNCVTEFIKEAPEWARDLDSRYRGKSKPPLFGVPFSVKENFHMIGYDSTVGLAKNIEDPMVDEASLVSHLRSLGAVPIVRTNVPQTMLSFSCSNQIYGVTKNPFNPICTPGGSSGGEGCLISAGGCPFGIGSDIGGSLRIPAHFCGLVTLKPSEHRLTVQNVQEGGEGCVRLGLSYGFFTKDVRSQIRLLSLTLCDDYFARSPYTVPLPFKSADLEPPVRDLPFRGRVGYYIDDGWMEAVPACRRAVEETAELLKVGGYELVRFTVPDPYGAFRMSIKALFSDNASQWLKILEYEDIDPCLAEAVKFAKFPLWLRSLLSKLLSWKWPRVSFALATYVSDLADLRQTFAEIKSYRINFARTCTEQGLDVLLCPVFPFAAIPYHWAPKLSPACSYTALFNLLDLPAGVVPVTRTTQADCQATEAYPSGGCASDLFSDRVRRAVKEAGVGLPVGVQVVGLPFREETCLRVMLDIEKGARFNN